VKKEERKPFSGKILSLEGRPNFKGFSVKLITAGQKGRGGRSDEKIYMIKGEKFFCWGPKIMALGTGGEEGLNREFHLRSREAKITISKLQRTGKHLWGRGFFITKEKYWGRVMYHLVKRVRWVTQNMREIVL